MKKIISITLIVGFFFVDMLFFHDVLKPGEVISFAQYLTGFLSVFVFVIAGQTLLQTDNATRR